MGIGTSFEAMKNFLAKFYNQDIDRNFYQRCYE